jgi:hypothetical protein
VLDVAALRVGISEVEVTGQTIFGHQKAMVAKRCTGLIQGPSVLYRKSG